MFESLLIANRGEIARRIIRTAKRLGIRTIAVYSDVDARALFVQEADKAIEIGPAPAASSYLRSEKILEAARLCGAAAIHPGYGFLSENAQFADDVAAAGLIWVGAPPAAIRAMGMKDAAKRLMSAAGVPVTPGYLGDDQNADRLKAEASTVGYPVLIKAVAGGGGKGMRRVERADDFAAALDSCRREAGAAFSDERVLIEKYISAPRHIEVQVFGDQHGNVVHMFERDCSVQRRHQKVIEEAPAPGMDPATREAICNIAVMAAKAVNYVGAGTIEFIADASDGLRADRIWFMEMNTRLQVEHPVTEAITGEDLVEWQLRVAAGQHLPKCQSELTITGWAMEARLYAENPSAGFLPSIGVLDHLVLPTDIRVDSGVIQGDAVTTYFDPMIAKLIAHGASREAARLALSNACASVEVWPVKTNAEFLARLLDHERFAAADIDTGFIARHDDELMRASSPEAADLANAARALAGSSGHSPWSALTGFRMSGSAEGRAMIEVEGLLHEASLFAPPALSRARIVGDKIVLFARGGSWLCELPRNDGLLHSTENASGNIVSPMPGRVISIAVEEGRRVAKGDVLFIVEAMKMENAVCSPFDATVTNLRVSVGDQVVEGIPLLELKRLLA